jgi:hypothetical protein
MVAAPPSNGAIDDPIIRQGLTRVLHEDPDPAHQRPAFAHPDARRQAKDMGVIALGATNKMFWSEMHKDAMELALDIYGAASMLVDTGPEERVRGRPCARKGRDDLPGPAR